MSPPLGSMSSPTSPKSPPAISNWKMPCCCPISAQQRSRRATPWASWRSMESRQRWRFDQIDSALIQRKADIHSHLEITDLAVHYIATDLRHLEPAQITDRPA